MGWVSPFLRRAVIEIDRVPDSKIPQDNSAGPDWRSVFQSFGWEVNVIVSDDDVTKKPAVWLGQGRCRHGDAGPPRPR
jgi:hypothetical protein